MNGLQIIIKNVLEEMAFNTAGQGGALGTSSGTPSQFSGNSVWNPNDNRLAQGLGASFPVADDKKRRSKKGKKGKAKKNVSNPTVIRRNLPRNSM